ncbi:MAG: ribulose phosphate epimerase [Clostridia bacterium BRH_c25]|nr:MAG: ribulose phosphate epimerase [Clostridia bacterium BRH_c25]
MISELKKMVVGANKELPARDLVKYSWGNVSAIDRENGVVIIKPVGIPYDELTVDNISVVDMDSKILEGPYNPSVDLPIHMVLYKEFPQIGAIVHTHSTYATMMAQLGISIPCFGTTHADYFYGEIPCTRPLTQEETGEAYEHETGKAIVEKFNEMNLSPIDMPGVLSCCHGPFTWGRDVWETVHKTVVLEEIAKMAWGVLCINPMAKPVPQYLLDRHFRRKHGPEAYFTNDDYGKGMVEVKKHE